MQDYSSIRVIQQLSRRPSRTPLLAALVATATAAAFAEPALRVIQHPPPHYPLGVAAVTLAASLVCVVRNARRLDQTPDIHDRQLDYILSAALVVSAVALLAMRGRHDAPVGDASPDLLALPFWSAAAVVLTGGTRLAWKVRRPILALLLAWPPLLGLTVRAVAAVTGPRASLLVALLIASVALLGSSMSRAARASRGRRAEAWWRPAAALFAGLLVGLAWLPITRAILGHDHVDPNATGSIVTQVLAFLLWTAFVLSLSRTATTPVPVRPAARVRPVPHLRLAAALLAVAALLCVAVNATTPASAPTSEAQAQPQDVR